MAWGRALETQTSTTYRFGPFEVVAASGELRKDGRRIKLQDQPFRLLVLLVENPGKVVSREEVQRRIWPENTFVDFDGSVRVAIRKLREALGDDAENPQYVETIPKRGYRLLVPVEHVAEAPRVAISDAEPAVPDERASSGKKSLRWLPYLCVAGMLLLAAAVMTLRFLLRAKPVLGEKDTVVITDFANTTGDPVFDEALRQGMAVQLEQSPYLSVVSDERIHHVLELMGAPPNTRLTPELARQVCERTGSAVTLNGSISRLGSQYVVGLRAQGCKTGDTLDEEQAQAATKEGVLKALDQVASRFRNKVGESLDTVKEHDTPLIEATTASLDALKAYSTGLRTHYASGPVDALPFFKRATEIDPNFAMAHAFLSRMYADINEAELASASAKRAYELKNRVSDREKFFIEVFYQTEVTEDMPKAEQACRVWAKTYPREPVPHDILAGVVYPVLGKNDRAIEEGRLALDMDRDLGITYSVLAERYLAANRLDEAQSILDDAATRKLDDSLCLFLRFDLAFLKGDEAGMQRAIEMSQNDPAANEWISHHDADVLAYAGRAKEARATMMRAIELARQGSHRDSAALYGANLAVWESFLGLHAAAVNDARAALKTSNVRGAMYGAALALGLSGRTAEAKKLANELEKNFPEDTSVQVSYLPVLRAQMAMNRRDAAKAMEALQPTIAYELSLPRVSIHANFGALYPSYLRGQIYLAERKPTEAAAEFERIVDHRGMVKSDPIGALAHLQLGRAYAMSGDGAKARMEYESFLSLWKNGDPDIPVLKEAKSEYSKLL